jgi:acyl carrier protein
MPGDSTMVEGGSLLEAVRGIVAEVLMVPRDSVHADSALVANLGAESIDFLDLTFRLEEILGKKIPIARWDAFVTERLSGADLSCAITTAVVVEFAERERDRS